MGHWEDRLLKAAWNNLRQWATDNPIQYSLAFGVGAVALQLAIVAGVLRASGLAEALLSLVLVPVALLVFMLGWTLLKMLYEVRAALGEHLAPAAADIADPGNFTCELGAINSNEISVRVTSHETTGDFHARVTELEGVEHDPAPIDLRWRSDVAERVRQINKGDSELLTVVRVRGRQAVDFLQPTPANEDRYQRVVAINGDQPCQVGAVLKVFNTRTDPARSKTHLLRLTFDNGADVPTPELVPLDDT